MTLAARVTPALDLPTATFALGTFAAAGTAPFAGLLLDGMVVDLARAHGVWTASSASLPPLTSAGDVSGLLQDWDRNLDALHLLSAFLRSETLGDERLSASVYSPEALRFLAPVQRPSKMLHAAQNYPDHVQEMRQARGRGFNTAAIDESQDFTGDRTTARPYQFLKAPSALTGAYDDIEIPSGTTQIDWEVELAVVMGRHCRRVSADDAMRHVAGFMTTNDVSCRDLLFRPDRERLRSDWLGGKSHDGFAPCGPVLVPRDFVPDHHALRLRTTVNGIVRQDGTTAHLIFSPEEQIEYASRMMTLEPGDVFATGTPGGVGQGSDTFLHPGDVVEAEVEGLGALRNRFVAAP